MSGLGQLLKKARQERGLSLDQLQDSTKIRKRYLEAIEEENFSVLPGSFYVRAFIKSYAEAVGVNPDEVIQLYQNVIPTARTEVNAESIRPKTRSRSNPNTERIARWALSLVVLLFFVLILMLIYHFVLSGDENDPTLIDDPPIVQNNDLGDEQQGGGVTIVPEPEPTPEIEPEPELTFVTTDGTTHVFTVTNTNVLFLELSLPNGSCWVRVVEGNYSGDILHEQTYATGQSDDWEAEDSLYIRLGNPRAAQLKVNGIEVDPEKFLADNPINFQFNLVKTNVES